MTCSIDCIVLPHHNYAPFQDLASLNQAFSLLYFSLTELKIPQEIDITLSLVSATSNQDFFSELISGLEKSQPRLKCRSVTLPESASSLAQGMEEGLIQSQSDYVLFLMPGGMLSSNFFEVLLPHLKNHENIIKTGVYDKGFEILQDATLEILLKSAPELMCKDFASFVLRRKYLLEQNFVDYAKKLGFLDLGLCASLMELVRHERQALLSQTSVNTSSNALDATKSIEGAWLSDTSTPSTFQGLQSADIQKFQKARPEDILTSKNHIFVTSLPYAKVYLPEQKFESTEQVSMEAQIVLHVLSSVSNISLNYFAVMLLRYFYSLPDCASSELKLFKIQEGVKLYNFVCEQLQSTGQGAANISRLDKMIDTIAQNPITSYIKAQDAFMLLDTVYKMRQRSAQLRVKELYSTHLSSLLMEQTLRERLLQDSLKVPEKGPILQCVSPAQKELLLDFKISAPNLSQVQYEGEIGKAMGEVATSANGNSVHLVSVVNNIPQYQDLFMANSNLVGHNCTLCPLLNPEPEHNDTVLGLPTLYNRFLDSFDYSKPSWLVFVHNDVEILGNLDILDNLPQDALYGPCGAYVANKKGLPTAVFIGHNLAQHPDSDMYFFGASQNNFRLFPQDREKYVVDTLDCLCLIVHSSLVDKYKLRFDEHLRFDLVVEDFCINAKVQHGVKTKLVKLLMNHNSATSALRLPPSYFASLKYINAKYPELLMAGTCSLLGGLAPLDQMFKH